MRRPRALIAGVLILLALVVLVGGSLYAGSTWFYVPPPAEDPDRLYKPFNAFLGWLLAGGGMWTLGSVALLSGRAVDVRTFGRSPCAWCSTWCGGARG